jgi:glycosyltransferase involved in cell wall biosynthesis
MLIQLARCWLRSCPVRQSSGRLKKRNALIARSKGEYIVDCDDDDYYSPQYITHMLSVHFWWSGSSLIPFLDAERNHAPLLQMHMGFGVADMRTVQSTA